MVTWIASTPPSTQLPEYLLRPVGVLQPVDPHQTGDSGADICGFDGRVELGRRLALFARAVRAVTTAAEGHVIIGARCGQVYRDNPSACVAAEMGGAGQ